MSLVLIKYILMAALRDKLIWGIIAMSIVTVCLSVFSGSAAIIEQSQFILAYMAGGLRVIILLGLCLFTVFYVRRSFDARDVEFLLTRPISRLSFVLSHVAGLSILSFVAGVALSLVVGGMAVHYGTETSVILWCLGVTFEFIIMANIAFFFAMVLSSPVTAGMATFGFYVLARLMGQLLAIVNKTPIPSDWHDYAMNSLSYVMGIISLIIPRFDLMAQTSWLIYGGGVVSDWVFIFIQGIVFLSLVCVAAWVDLRRRQF